MELDRGVLARIDRKLLAGLGQNETDRMVRVPVTASKWSTWKRYCDSAGVSMGRAIVTLINRELASVFGDHTGDHPPVFAEQAEEELTRRQAQVTRRELDAAAAEERLRAWNERLHTWEGELEAREQRAELTAKIPARPRETPTRVKRNERCPCGSGLKYKHCHGLPGR
ncbi:MAG: SEC-C domain-containing protein [Acidimicrobiia bacterium]|nr:SEC-C domain-containing protein [Acidimicrobiia bacterium]